MIRFYRHIIMKYEHNFLIAYSYLNIVTDLMFRNRIALILIYYQILCYLKFVFNLNEFTNYLN